MSFSDIHHYKLLPFPYEGKIRWRVSPFADGNCGLYAFSCALVDNIINGKLRLKDTKFKDFIKKVNDNLSASSEQTSNYRAELENELSIFKQLIQRSDLTFSQFKAFLTGSPLTRHRLAAINLVLEPGLRFLGVEAYKKEIGVPEGSSLEEDKTLLNAHAWVGEETLSPLAKCFGINISYISREYTDAQPNTYEDRIFLPLEPENENTTAFTLMNIGGHWSYLIPEEDTVELANSGLENSLPIVHSSYSKIEQLRQSLDKNHSNESIVFSTPELNQFSETLNEISSIAEDFFSHKSNAEEYQAVERQVKLSAHKTIDILNLWRTKHYQTNSNLDLDVCSHLNQLNTHALVKQLIQAPFDMAGTADSVDANLAVILQTTEIISFIQQEIETLAKTASTIPQTNTKIENNKAFTDTLSRSLFASRESLNVSLSDTEACDAQRNYKGFRSDSVRSL